MNYNALTDQQLATLLKDGNQGAFTQLYDRYNSLLYVHAYKKLQNREQAKDVVQDVFIMVWTKHLTLNFTTNLAGFLYTCLHHKVLDFIAHQKMNSGHITVLQHFIKTVSKGTDYLIREKQLYAIIEKEIAELPPKMRQVFELSRWQHLSHKEIATQLDVSEETVKKQIKNALKILRSKLGFFVYLFLLIRY